MFLLFFVTDKKYQSSASFANKIESSLFKKGHFSLLSLNGMLEDPHEFAKNKTSRLQFCVLLQGESTLLEFQVPLHFMLHCFAKSVEF